MDERDKNQGRAATNDATGGKAANATGNSTGCCSREGGHDAAIGRTPSTAKQSQTSTLPAGKTQTRMTRPMTSVLHAANLEVAEELERAQKYQGRLQDDLDCSSDALTAATKEFSDC